MREREEGLKIDDTWTPGRDGSIPAHSRASTSKEKQKRLNSSYVKDEERPLGEVHR